MVVIIIYLAVFAGGFGVVLLKECLKEYRRQTRGLTLDEQFQRTIKHWKISEIKLRRYRTK